jgi:hypothetical protein
MFNAKLVSGWVAVGFFVQPVVLFEYAAFYHLMGRSTLFGCLNNGGRMILFTQVKTSFYNSLSVHGQISRLHQNSQTYLRL